MNRSKIPWLVNADGTPGYTWSPTSGCSPISAGCLNCWARAYHVRYRGGDFGVKLHPEKLDEPLRLRKPSVIGVSLLGDLFHCEVPYIHIRTVFDVMGQAEQHTFLVLTKRPGRYAAWEKWLHQDHTPKKPWPWTNVWLGVSVEDQATADERIPILLDTPAAHRLVSLEPQIGPVSFDPEWMMGLSLIVQGCESGPKRRPFDVAWARNTRAECAAARVPFALKQMPVAGRVMEKPGLDDELCWELPWEVPA